MFGLGFQEIVLLALLLFGSRRLPEIGKALGKSINEFKKAFQGDTSEEHVDDKKTGS